MKYRRVLITGTGRCRTAWVAKGLSALHQQIKHEHAIDGFYIGVPPEDTVDVSFEAAPLSSWWRRNGGEVFLLVRDPAAVVRSWLSLGAFTEGMPHTHAEWWRSLEKWAPEVTEGRLGPVERAIRFYIRWNQLALLGEPTIIRLGEDETELIDIGGIVGLPWTQPGRVDDGTPAEYRIPVVLPDDMKASIRCRVRDALPGSEFDFVDEETT